MKLDGVLFFLVAFLRAPQCGCLGEQFVVDEFPSNNTDGGCSTINLTLNHMAIDNVANKIYVAGVNRIYRTDMSLNVDSCVVTGPKEDNTECHASGCSTPMEMEVTDNINKILLLDHEHDTLIACGTIRQGSCVKHSLKNLTNLTFVPIGIAANDAESSTYAFIGPERYTPYSRTNVMYVGTTFTKNSEYRHDVPAISSHSLQTLKLAEDTFTKQTLVRVDVKYRDQFLVRYVYGFNTSDYAYFVTSQWQSHLQGQNEFGHLSRLARVCVTDQNYDSYVEVTLQCLVKETDGEHAKIRNYNLAQDAKIIPAGEELAESFGIKPNELVLVVSFSPSRDITNEPKTDSAICMYSLREIEAKFNENIFMCFNGSLQYRNMAYISGPITNGLCQNTPTATVSNFCEIGLKISGVVPVTAIAAITFENKLITSVAATTTEKSTVAFLGTSDGYLKKVLLITSNRAYEYEELLVDSGNSVLPDTAVAPRGNYLYVMTTNKVLKMNIEHCLTYSNCSSCLEARDPYCGWCSLEKRCTIRNSCQQASQSLPRWLSSSAGQQCIDFEQVLPDRIPINQYTTVNLTIRTLPALPIGTKYRCVFGGAEPVDAKVTAYGLTCPTPPKSARPRIPENQDHVYVPLSVRSTETDKDFVSRNFAFYECGAHNKCMDCVQSAWACNWCVYENKCTHNVSSCPNNAVISSEQNPTHLYMHGRGYCPQFRKPVDHVMIPNGVSKAIILDVNNIPKPTALHTGFKCIVTLDDAQMAIPARVENGRFVVCDKTLYTYRANTSEYEAVVRLVWNQNHHVDTTNVTLYKCEILGSHRDHPDCSLCITQNVKYNCTWCSNGCRFIDSCRSPHTIECPKPRIDMIKPLSGPIEGGTIITIEGSNLGFRAEDVANRIRIGDSACILLEYHISVKIICRTGPSLTRKTAPFSIGNTAGVTETSVHFAYEDFKLTSVTPNIGPLSGGTQLAISGSHLNIGSTTKAYLDHFPCTINSTQATSSRITCTTPRVSAPYDVHKVIVSIDGANRTLSRYPFRYKLDPTVSEIKPLSSFVSGGRLITVHGTNFDTIQKPEMIVCKDSCANPINKTECVVRSTTHMECPSPAVNEEFSGTAKEYRRRKRLSSYGNQNKHLVLKVGFNMDNVESVKELEKYYKDLPSNMIYREDPNYLKFPNEIKVYKGDSLVIEGEFLNSASDDSDVSVTIGTARCNITALAFSQLVCNPPAEQPAPTDEYDKLTDTQLPLVVIHAGLYLRFPVGYIQYEMVTEPSFPKKEAALLLIILMIILFLFVCALTFYRQKSSQAEREYRRIQLQMDTLESNVRLECKQAFVELQTGMTDLSTQIVSSTGVPVFRATDYILKVFFPGVRDHPILSDPKVRENVPPTNYDAAMLLFHELVRNKHFVVAFIDTIEVQNSFELRDRVNVASLMMVVMMDRLDYATDVLHALLLRLIKKSIDSNFPHLMLRRTESVVEKMLTNWMAVCMYGFLRDRAGPPMFSLYKALKHQLDKGPIDVLTHESRYSLSEERLIREVIPHTSVLLHVLDRNGREKIQCEVLDCDSISQVKMKILDTIYKNVPYSRRPSIHSFELSLDTGPERGFIPMMDEDVSNNAILNWKKLNTIGHYEVGEEAVVMLTPRAENNVPCRHPCPSCSDIYLDNVRQLDTQNVKVAYYHLVKSGNYDTLSPERSQKVIPEIYLTRMLSTKGTVQKFIDDFFHTVFTVNHDLPFAVKWLFDVFDQAFNDFGLTDLEVLHAWKSNSFPLRFWVNFIKNPDFILDIHKTAVVDACLSVIAQMFMDSCSMTDIRLGQDSPSNKLLFAKDIPRYREVVLKFYKDIQALPTVTVRDVGLQAQCMARYEFTDAHIVSALKELYIYVSKYYTEISQVLESMNFDPEVSDLHLDRRLERIASILGEDLPRSSTER